MPVDPSLAINGAEWQIEPIQPTAPAAEPAELVVFRHRPPTRRAVT